MTRTLGRRLWRRRSVMASPVLYAVHVVLLLQLRMETTEFKKLVPCIQVRAAVFLGMFVSCNPLRFLGAGVEGPRASSLGAY